MSKAKFKTKLQDLMRAKSLERGELLTQSELARATALSFPTIHRLHRGQVERLEAETIRRLTTYFDCKVGDLIEVE